MGATIANFRAYFPEFNSEGDASIQLFLDLAAEQVNESAWGSGTLLVGGQCYLAAHMLALKRRGESGSGGAVISSKVGDLQRTYADVSAQGGSSSDVYKSTPYGATFLIMRRQVLVTPMVTC